MPFEKGDKNAENARAQFFKNGMTIRGSLPPQATSLDLFAKNQDLKIFDLPLLNCHFPPDTPLRLERV